jgi:hypothetical protein
VIGGVIMLAALTVVGWGLVVILHQRCNEYEDQIQEILRRQIANNFDRRRIVDPAGDGERVVRIPLKGTIR